MPLARNLVPAREKTFVHLAMFDPLPTVTPAGSGRGKTLTSSALVQLVADGVTVPDTTYTVLIGGQVDPDDNGVYDVTEEGLAATTAFILTRRQDADLPVYYGQNGFAVEVQGKTGFEGTDFDVTRWGVIGVGTTPDTDSIIWRPESSQLKVGGSNLAADADDFGDGVPGYKTASVFFIDGGAANRNITGLDANYSSLLYKSSGEGYITALVGRITLVNEGLTNTLILKHNDNGVNSLARNEFIFPTGLDHVLGPGDSIDLYYDGIPGQDHWEPI